MPVEKVEKKIKFLTVGLMLFCTASLNLVFVQETRVAPDPDYFGVWINVVGEHQTTVAITADKFEYIGIFGEVFTIENPI